MGVHGLWDLLSPVGRRVSVETLAGKRLAIDASIWMIQFMKAMRDEKGEMVRNAHLLGFFRRICKLLYLRTKPVFIFDGCTPALKRRTVIARRRQRENAQAKIRKTAEKLLLNQLKQIRLKELADELEKQKRSNNLGKGKNVVTEEADMVENTSGRTRLFADSFNQEAVDEMLAASLAAEEDEGFTAGESSSGVQIQPEKDDDGEDEEMILPTMQGKLDPAILAALPPSMQLDLLVQMRERLMAENRQKYQRVKKVPARFSELQIQSYLKTVAFRREIDEVQKSAAGRGIGGVQTSRIASEANREFIFSSNYNGDKIVLTSTGEGRKNSEQSQAPSLNPSGNATVNHVASIEKSSATAVSPVAEPQRDLENDVETYLDERGRVRVSRVRAMGIRMTRDLQRNLDMMKEIEEDREGMTKNSRNQLKGYGTSQGKAPSEIQFLQASDEYPCGMTSENDKNEETVMNAGTSMEISFEDNGHHELGGDDDDLFAHLVSGDPVMDFSVDKTLSNKQSSDSASEPEWEEGIIEDEGGALSSDIKLEDKPLQVDGMSVEHELEWEEGSLNMQEEASSCPAEFRKIVSKGALEEEADFQEAIKKSLQDMEVQISVDEPDQGEKTRATAEVVNWGSDAGFAGKEEDGREGEAPSRFSSIQHHDSPCEVDENSKSPDGMVERKLMETNTPLEVHVSTELGGNSGKMEVLPVTAYGNDPGLELLIQDVGENWGLEREIRDLGTSAQENRAYEGQLIHSSDSDNAIASATVDVHSKWATETEKASGNDSVKDVDSAREFAEEEVNDYFSNKGEEALHKSASSDRRKEDIEVTEASLEDEMLILGKERKELVDEQRKLERNAESVSNEMFAECQELLQMFGLPYIIAPMEAEAQCAYMELVNLVDGVVTDDSDAFLFGAQSVYKNIFDDRKYVETYFMKDIENELGLSREKLIRMALLLGSDYTEGVSGIGIVNAIEVVNAFPDEDGLRKFREWIESPDPSILGKFDAQAVGNSKQIESQVDDMERCSDGKLLEISAPDGNVSGSVDEAQKIKQIFMDKHRNVSKNWHIPSSFPSDVVISAYDSPQVDKSTDPFSWGKPDHFVLRKLCWEKFGWSTQKADELLLPVLREYNKRETQLRLEAFYTFNERFAKIRSKRIKKAVKGITGNRSLNLMDESVQDGLRNKKKRRVNQDDAVGAKSDASNEASATEKLNGKKPRKKSAGGGPPHATDSRNKLPGEDEISESQREGASARGRTRVGVGGAGRDHSVRKRRKTNPSSKYAISCSDDDSHNEGEQDSQVGFREPPRRSGRPRKEVNYTMSDLKYDDTDRDDVIKPSHEDAARGEPFSDGPEDGYSAAAPGKINNTEHMDPELSGDCNERGESFAVDKAKQDQVSSCPTVDFIPETQLSEECLTMGGGFCLDEDVASDRKLQELCSTTGTVYDSVPPNGSDDSRKESLICLRAMPNLKRKRNKN